MMWLLLGLTTMLLLLLVWIATKESRGVRVLGTAAVLVHTLMLIAGLRLEPTGIWITLARVIGIASQATILGVVTLWIATRQSHVGRVIGALILAVLSMTLTYQLIVGATWKINVVNVAAITLTWMLGRQRRVLART